MFDCSNRRSFVILTMIIAVTRNLYLVNSVETTETPIEVVEVEEVSAAPSTAQTSARVSDSSTSTDATTFSIYVCENSFDIHTMAEFEKYVLNSTKPIMVQFHAPWSDPCKILTPRIGRAIDDRKGKIKLARVDIEEHEKIGLLVGVQIVPCIAAFRGGELIEKLTGLQEESNLKIFIGKYIVD